MFRRQSRAVEIRTARGPVERRRSACSIGGPYTVGIAGAARPGGVPAAVAEAGLVTDEDLAWRRAACPFGHRVGRVGDPLPGRGLYQLA